MKTSILSMMMVAAGTLGFSAQEQGTLTLENGRVGLTLPHDSIVYVVASPQTPLEKRVTGELCAYLGKVIRKPPQIVSDLSKAPGTTPAIILSSRPLSTPVSLSAPQGDPEAYALLTTAIGKRPVVLAVGNTDKGLKRAVQRLVIKSRQEKDALVIPNLAISEKPWIPEREWSHCPWVSRVPRYDHRKWPTNTDMRVDVSLYNDEQLSNYAAMFDWFGFSGVQLMETCYSYAVFKSPDAYQNWEKVIARAARENGQNVSLWVWAAQFNDYAWSDPDVVYAPQQGKSAFEDPKVYKAFEKYYDVYARMAPDVDRLIAHFYDPGNLKNREDVFQYMRLLEGKFKQKNPAIKVAVDGWGSGLDYLDALVQNGFKDHLLLVMSMPNFVSSAARTSFHERAKKLGCNIGIWGWYTTEHETDQFPTMHVNAQIYKRLCQQIKEGAFQVYPVSYWSEMEAYHLNNIYTLYAASRLLWNPDGDPHEILGELCEGIWGPRNGSKVLSALELIQDCRSGPKWETYWWTCSEYRLGTADPKEDLRRADESIAALESMQTDPEFVPKFPLPFPPATFAELITPHLKQIRALAEFRVKMNRVREAAEKGAPKEKLAEMVVEAWQPIPFFNTWVGEWGLPESEAQDRIVRCLCKDLNLQIADPEWYAKRDAVFFKFMGGIYKSFRGGNSNVR